MEQHLHVDEVFTGRVLKRKADIDNFRMLLIDIMRVMHFLDHSTEFRQRHIISREVLLVTFVNIVVTKGAFETLLEAGHSAA